MDELLDSLVGGRDQTTIKWLGLGYTSRKLDGKRLGKISGLEEFSSLLSLDLSGNALADVEGLRGLIRLEELDLSKNRFKRLEGIGRLRSLRVLNVSNNAIEHIPKQFNLLTELRWLDISGNRLSVVREVSHLSDCRNLHRVNIKGNPLCQVSNVNAAILNYLPSLVNLNGFDVNVTTTGQERRYVYEHVKEDEMKAKTIQEYEKQVKQEREVQARLIEDNQELRSELEATSQLLSAKTSEWAVAEEQKSRYQQELAFLKIDQPSFNNKTPGASTAITTTSRSSEPKPEKSSSIAVNSSLKSIDAEIRNNAKRTETKLRALGSDYKQAKQSVETLQSQLDIAIAAYNRTKDDQEAAERCVVYRSKMKTSNNPSPKKRQQVVRKSPAEDEKCRELSDLSMLLGKLRDLRGVLKKKMELAQDLLVVRTENLVSEDTGGMTSPRQERLDRLESEFERACVNTIAASSDISFSVTSNSRIRDFLPDLSLIHTHGAELEVSDGKLSGFGSMFDASITALSEEVMKTKEQDLNVKQCLDACLVRVSQVESTIASIQESRVHEPVQTTGYADDDDDDDAEEEEIDNSLRAQLLQSSVEKEADTIKVLNDELKAGHVKVREIQIAILKLKCDSWKTEATLRAKQCSILFHALETKDATVEACNRTIERLESSSTPAKQQHRETTPAVVPTLPLASEIIVKHKRNDVSSEDEEESVELDLVKKTSSLMNASEQKARACRKQVYDELLSSEDKFVEDLTMLIDVYVTPMRRRCMLPPRDLQVICGNMEHILRVHKKMIQSIANRRDVMGILRAFVDNLGQLEELYTKYYKHCAVSLSMVYTRQHEVANFCSFLQTCEKNVGVHIVDLMLLPLTRLAKYERSFSSLNSLHTGTVSSSNIRSKLGIVRATIGEMLGKISTSQSKVVEHAKTLSHIQSVLPPHGSLGKREVSWLAEARISLNVNRKLIEKVQLQEAMVLVPRKKAISFTNCICFVYSDCVVLGASPVKFRATFDGERPKLKACGVFRAEDGLSCSRPFTTNKSVSGVRLSCRRFGVKKPLDDDDYVEVILQFKRHSDAENVSHTIDKHLHVISPQVANCNHQQEEEEVEIAMAEDENNTTSRDELSYTPKYPGTDMLKRRMLAQQIRERRATWVKPQLENLNASLAQERIRKRDGVLNVGDSSDVLQLRQGEPLPNNPESKEYFAMTPIRTVSPIKPRARPQEPLGFGSSVKLSRNQGLKHSKAPPTPTRAKENTTTTAASSPVARRARREEQFDFESPYYPQYGSEEASRPPDLSIFKTPKKHEPHVNPGVGFQSKRLLGLEWVSSEYIKEANKNAESYYSSLSASRADSGDTTK